MSLSSPEVKERIKEEVVNSYVLPLMVAAKIADKITGSSLAPYYFCKYFVSMHDMLESYIGMIKYCQLGATWEIVLRSDVIREAK